jgi:hypothetical protein
MRVNAFGLAAGWKLCEDAPVRLHPHDLPGSKLETQKVEVDVRAVAAPVHILTVDDLRLLWMQLQLAGRKAVGNRAPQCPRLLGALAVTNGIIRIPLERDMWRARPERSCRLRRLLLMTG